MRNLQWDIHKFEDLNARQLHDILKLRQDVFIIEQDCMYTDIDGNDPHALHLIGYQEHQLIAYARIFEPGKKYTEASVGRIVIGADARNLGLGKVLVKRANDYCDRMYSNEGIRIEAQAHLIGFYSELGYRTVGDIYGVDGIEHIQMVRTGSGA